MFSGAQQPAQSRRRIAFDLDETLGVPAIDGANIVGWSLRTGCGELLAHLQPEFDLCLWSVSSRRYVEKVLTFGLGQWFREVYTWDELPVRWKDVRQVRVDYLVDDSPHHRDVAASYGLDASYILVPSYGSLEDTADPIGWVRLVQSVTGCVPKENNNGDDQISRP